jgi:hypothetical protein
MIDESAEILRAMANAIIHQNKLLPETAGGRRADHRLLIGQEDAGRHARAARVGLRNAGFKIVRDN